MPRKETDWPKLLKAIKRRTGKKHAELAAMVGVSTRTWRSWLYGQRTPSGSAEILIKIRFFGQK